MYEVQFANVVKAYNPTKMKGELKLSSETKEK